MKDEIKKLIDMAEKGAGFTFYSGKKSGDTSGIVKNVGEAEATHIIAYDKNSPENAHEFAKILNCIPDLLSDVDTLTKIVVEQQKQISILQETIETVALGDMQIKGLEKLNDYITKWAMHGPLKEVGSDGGLTLRLSSSFYSDSDEAHGSATEKKRSRESDMDFAASVGGVLKLFSNLKIGGGTKEIRDSWDKALSYFRKISKEGLTMTGEAIYKLPALKFRRTDSKDPPLESGKATIKKKEN